MPTWGRGGAGNIVSQAQVEEQTRRIAEHDLEANNTLTTSPPPPSTTQTQEYAHTGRGGAGNWYQPSTLSATGTFTQPSDSTAQPTSEKPEISKPWTPAGVDLPIARAGRGGAGNMVWKDGEEKAKEEGERRLKEKKVEEGVVADVEKGLQRPGRAVLGKEDVSGMQYVWS